LDDAENVPTGVKVSPANSRYHTYKVLHGAHTLEMSLPTDVGTAERTG
jgi:hypothetical protein